VYWALWGMKFGIGFAILILIHEMGHFVDVKRRGLPAEMPVFLPGLGAYVKWQALGVTLETRAGVSLAAPLAGWLASATCVAIWWNTGDPFWACSFLNQSAVSITSRKAWPLKILLASAASIIVGNSF
jgi:hypothetical protein